MAKSYKDIHHALHHWYAQHGRKDLPWRNTDDAYKIYLSEVMLQQTQVKTVLERFYFPFLEKFPTLQALAEADLQEVLKVWEGLGYYTRARNLHKAAQATAPHLPKDIADLQALPGIGQNTAHAIAAFAYHQPVPVMEANLKRVLCRFFALKNPSQKQLWQAAQRLLDVQNPFDYNQAMMDIGATICTAKKPDCGQCPLSASCVGQKNPHAYPQPKAKKAKPTRRYVIIVWQNTKGECYLLRREEKLLHGMYGFAQYERGHVLPKKRKKLGRVTHHYSHFTLEAEIYLAPAEGAKLKGGGWYDKNAIAKLPLSGADKKVLALV